MLYLALPLATARAPFLAAACGSRGTGPPHSELPSAPHPADLVRVGHRWAPSITQRRRLPSYHETTTRLSREDHVTFKILHEVIVVAVQFEEMRPKLRGEQH